MTDASEQDLSDPRIPLINETLELMRPAIQSDGGDIIFNKIDEDGTVHVELQGACVGCSTSTMTISAGVERILLDRVPDITRVINDAEFIQIDHNKHNSHH